MFVEPIRRTEIGVTSNTTLPPSESCAHPTERVRTAENMRFLEGYKVFHCTDCDQMRMSNPAGEFSAPRQMSEGSADEELTFAFPEPSCPTP